MSASSPQPARDAAHAWAVTTVASRLGTDPRQGLAEEQVGELLRIHGENRLTPKDQRPLWLQFLAQFNAPLLYALLITGAIKAAMGALREALVIWSVTVINAVIGFVQESRAEQSITALAAAIRSDAEVVRGGRRQQVDSEQLVPGDLVLLTAGDRVPADLRLLHARNLQLDESTLTGESLPVAKGTDPDPADAPLAERYGMAHAGSFVTSGQGQGLVVATGDDTAMGAIAASLKQGSGLSTPLTRKFARFSFTILWLVLVLSLVTALVGLARGRPGSEMFDAAVALAVSAIPEELPAIVTITLAIGVHRMARRNAILRRLPAVEALGSATVICSDKTGTLTQNRMTVQELFAAGERVSLEDLWPGEGAAGDTDRLRRNTALRETLLAGLLCNDARPGANGSAVGDPTETALLVAAQRLGFDHASAHSAHPRRDALPFESERQVMATLHGSDRILVKGSVEAVLPRCSSQCGPAGVSQPLDRSDIQAAVEAMAAAGERVLAFAMGPAESEQRALEREDIASQLTFLGLQGMADPPRPEAIRAVAACRSAGITVKMITGDHIGTARAIARAVGIGDGERLTAIEGRQLDGLDGTSLAQLVRSTDVFARVAPAQKLQLVEALQADGEIVAMTGDGVNDGPALRRADIGIAMGEGGTAVAREAAAMVLTDDNFATIEAAVEEGRGVALNLRRALAFCLPVNGGESMTILFSALLGLALPITALQVLWLNMVTALTMTVPLSFEPKPQGLMAQPPQSPERPLLDPPLLRRLLLVSSFSWIVIFTAFLYGQHTYGNADVARTMAVQALVLSKVAYLISLSEWSRHPPGRGGRLLRMLGRFPALPLGVVVVLILQLLFSQWGPMNLFFDTAPLTLRQWGLCSLAIVPMIPVALLASRIDPLLPRRDGSRLSGTSGLGSGSGLVGFH